MRWARRESNTKRWFSRRVGTRAGKEKLTADLTNSAKEPVRNTVQGSKTETNCNSANV